MKQKTKITAILMAMVLVITAICNHGVAAEAAVKVGNGRYTVTSEKNKTVRFDKPSKKNVKSLTIPATVKVGKQSYKVTSIKEGALKNNKSIQKIVIGKNVKSIKAKACYGCSNLKRITIKSTKITAIGKNAFGKLNNKTVVILPTMSENKVKSYKKLLKKGGLTGKNQVIKTDKPTATTSPKKPTTLPDPTVELRINPLQDKGLYWPNTVTEVDSETGKRVELAIRTDIPLDFYGYWEKVKNVKSDYMSICRCGLVATSKEDRIIHGLQSGHQGYTVRTKGNSAFDASVWHPDNTPCGIVYHTILPEGLEIVEDSISVAQLSWTETLIGNVTNADYKVSVEGNNLTISIDNIKTGGFCFSDGDIRYRPIVVSFSVKVTDSASAVNPVSASVSYSQGKYKKTIATNTVTVSKK